MLLAICLNKFASNVCASYETCCGDCLELALWMDERNILYNSGTVHWFYMAFLDKMKFVLAHIQIDGKEIRQVNFCGHQDGPRRDMVLFNLAMSWQ